MNESKLQKLLTAGQFVVSGEIGPPKSANGEKVYERALMLKDYVDAVNLTDNQTAIVRLCSLAAAAHVIRAGLEPIMQMTCRDRNRIGLQSDLLGAHSLGVSNILCLSGDHQCFGNHPTAKNVWDIDSLQLVNTVKRMRDDHIFLCGEEMKADWPGFFIGAAANPFGDPFEFRVFRMEKKINAGADFIQTQCIFDLERFERFMEMARNRGLHKRAYILAGVMPFKSARAAKYNATSVSGMMVPPEAVARMEQAADPKEEGITICVEIMQRLRNIEGIAGIHIMAPMWEDVIPELVKRAGLYPRPAIS